MNERILNIRKHGKTARGQKELLKHLTAEKLTFRQAIYAKCYDCTNYFSDGKQDCKMTACPLYPFMAYANRGKQAPKKPMAGDHVHTGAAIS
ncbi:MAG: hypothetical protein APR62_05220 [Smithella sp. SDB]|nr:MAG: hypothetical protein APR62_05220 [Smithella sp. SDB]